MTEPFPAAPADGAATGLTPVTQALAAPAAAGPDPWVLAAAFWAAGCVVAAAWIVWSQRRALAALEDGQIGPAVVGVLRPRIVTPPDFEERFAPQERELVLAHEQIHLRRQDARVNAAVALWQCLCWFNPLIHLGAHLMRVDQEMACDAEALAQRPKQRRLYAEALLKAQLAAHPLPLGCYWPAGTRHPLAVRIAMLKAARPTAMRRLAGAALLGALATGGGFAAWAAKPLEVSYDLVAAPVAQEVEPDVARPTASAPQAAGPATPTPAEPVEPTRVAGAPCLTNACDDAAAPAPVSAAAPDWTRRVDYIGASTIPSGLPFARVFDGNAPTLIRGQVVEVRWPGEGISAELVVQGEDGRRYRIIGGDAASIPPEARASIYPAGSQVVVRGYNAFDTSCEGGGCIVNGRDITYADGSRVFMPNNTPSPTTCSATPSCSSRQ